MRQIARSVAAMTFLNAGICAALVALPANAVQHSDRRDVSSAIGLQKPDPTAPPDTKVEPTKDGAIAKSWRKVGGRFEGDPPPPKRSQNPKPVSDETRPDSPRNMTRPLKREDFRLNIGICGRVGADGTAPGPTRCQPFEPDTPDPTRRTLPPTVVQPPRPSDVTWEQVSAESKDVVFPQLHVKVQPAGRTLVNLDTIVYTDESKVSTDTVTLLGFPVVVEATPMSYSWNFGDGSPILTTTSPGKPYPSKEITHKYMRRGSAKVTVTTHYAARFNVAGTGWQYVNGTIPITGPATALLIREAVPVLVDPPR